MDKSLFDEIAFQNLKFRFMDLHESLISLINFRTELRPYNSRTPMASLPSYTKAKLDVKCVTNRLTYATLIKLDSSNLIQITRYSPPGGVPKVDFVSKQPEINVLRSSMVVSIVSMHQCTSSMQFCLYRRSLHRHNPVSNESNRLDKRYTH